MPSRRITLDPDALADWADNHGLGGKSYADLVKSDAVHDMVGEYVATLKAESNRWEPSRSGSCSTTNCPSRAVS